MRALESLSDRIDLVFEGKYCDELTLALAHTHRTFTFDRQPFEDLFLGLKSDLIVTQFPTFERVREYCYRVASTVGLLCLSIFGCNTSETRKYAEHLGIAMQLTNILRDLAEDLQRGRIYLPQSDLSQFGLTSDNILKPGNRDRLSELVSFEVRRAEGYYQSATELLPRKFNRKLLGARIMGAIYREILERIRQSDRHDKRISLSASTKVKIAASVMSISR